MGDARGTTMAHVTMAHVKSAIATDVSFAL
jgi:hypothetical protein